MTKKVPGFSSSDPGYKAEYNRLYKDRLAKERKEIYETTGKRKARRRRYWITKYKEAKGCERCGYNEDAVALDFDHIDPSTKSFCISVRTPRYPLKSVINEIRKCRILCANCHRILTHRKFTYVR